MGFWEADIAFPALTWGQRFILDALSELIESFWTLCRIDAAATCQDRLSLP
jgi:hypothetical protein